MKEIISPNDVYAIESTLSISSENTVYMASSKLQSTKFRIRVTSKFNVNLTISEEQYETQLNIIKSVEHPNIIKLCECFDDQDNYYIITEFFSHQTLSNYIENFGIVPDSRAKDLS